MTTSSTRTGVLQIVQCMRPGGIETMALDLVDETALGGEIVSLAGDTSELIAAWPALKKIAPRLTALDQDRLRPRQLLFRLVQLLRQRRPAAVVLHHIGPLLYGGLAARIAGVPTVIHVEHDAWHYANRKHRWITIAAEHLVRPRRVAVSDEIALRVRDMLPRARLAVIAPGIETERFKPADKAAARRAIGLDREVRIIGSVGRLAAVKGHRHLVEALAQLPGDVHAVLVGDGPERDALEKLAQDLGVGHRLHLLGLRADPERILPAFDVFCLPSLAEGLPRAVLEAESCGLPVVASDVGALAAALAPGGRLVPAGDARRLAQAIGDVLAAPASVQATRAHVVERYSLDATTRALRCVLANGVGRA